MDNGNKDPDRAILDAPRAYWAEDPDETLTDAELDQVLEYFSGSSRAGDPALLHSIQWQFQSFVVAARTEAFREINGLQEKVSKPSTIVEREMRRLSKACQDFDKQLARLDPATKTWLDQYLKEIGTTDENGGGMRLRDLEGRIFWTVDILIYAAHSAEGMAAPGPSNMALRMMVEKMAGCWEICFDKPPTTDKARGRQEDPFLALCQKMASFAQARLNAKGGSLGTLQLSGLVADVLKKRRSQVR